MKTVTKPFLALIALIAFMCVSLAPAQRFLTKPTEVSPPATIFSQAYLFDASGYLVLDGVDRYLYNSSGTQLLSFGSAIRSIYPSLTLSTPTTGGTITLTAKGDETVYITPAGTLATLTVTLPAAASMTVGDRKTIYFSQIITALTVNSTGTGTIAGTALTAAAAATSYEYVCVSTASTGTWLRIR
jgi:hypothetical protein